MVNMLREHVPQDSRIHYVITDGGDAPNIVPEQAQVYYYVRHPQLESLSGLFDRVLNAARAAALGTDTQVDVEVMHGNYPILPNTTLAQLVYENMIQFGGITYTEEEQNLCRKYSDNADGGLPLGWAVNGKLRLSSFVKQWAPRMSVTSVGWCQQSVFLYSNLGARDHLRIVGRPSRPGGMSNRA